MLCVFPDLLSLVAFRCLIQWRSQNDEKKIRTSKGDYWIKQWVSSIAYLIKMETSLKGKNLLSEGANSFLYEKCLIVWKITFITLSDLTVWLFSVMMSVCRGPFALGIYSTHGTPSFMHPLWLQKRKFGLYPVLILRLLSDLPWMLLFLSRTDVRNLSNGRYANVSGISMFDPSPCSVLADS